MSLRCSEFAEHALGLSLWPKQKQILNNLFENKINHAVWCLGRRSSKSTMAAIAAVYMAFCQEDHFRRKVRKGEKYYVITIANDLKQAKFMRLPPSEDNVFEEVMAHSSWLERNDAADEYYGRMI